MGHGREDDELTPRLVQGLVGHKATAVAAGGEFTAVVTDAGELFTFGDGGFGSLGHGSQENEYAPRLVQGLLAGKKVVAVAAGAGHAVVCTDAGEVFTCGDGEDGALGHGNREDKLSFCRVEALVGRKIVAVAAGCAHTVVATDAGEVLTFGGWMRGGVDHAGEADEVLPRVVDFRYLLGPQ